MAPSQLRQAREIYGDDEGKVYGALLSQEAGTSLERSGGGGSRVALLEKGVLKCHEKCLNNLSGKG